MESIWDEYANGKYVSLEQQKFCIGLPYGGRTKEEANGSQYDSIMAGCGDHFVSPYSGTYCPLIWCQEKSSGHKRSRVIRGVGLSNGKEWQSHVAYQSRRYLGFRPILYPIARLGGYDETVFQGIRDGTVIPMYTLLINGQPVGDNQEMKNHGNNFVPSVYEKGANLEFTDKFYDRKYLIPWVIYQGIAFSREILLTNISWNDLRDYGFATPDS